MLKRKTRDALRSLGYSAELRAPDPAHPAMHSLTLAMDEYTITVEFQHKLENGGEHFTIKAEVKMSRGSHAQVDSALGSDQADRHTVYWEDCTAWRTELPHQSVRLSAAAAETLTLYLGLEFVGRGVYSLRVDFLSDTSSASSAAEMAVDQGGEAREMAEEYSHSEEADIEDAAQEEAGGCEMESMESRDVVATSCDTGGGDGHDTLA